LAYNTKKPFISTGISDKPGACLKFQTMRIILFKQECALQKRNRKVPCDFNSLWQDPFELNYNAAKNLKAKVAAVFLGYMASAAQAAIFLIYNLT
jgi:hypothetical protein